MTGKKKHNPNRLKNLVKLRRWLNQMREELEKNQKQEQSQYQGRIQANQDNKKSKKTE
jgi:hypothetical protein